MNLEVVKQQIIAFNEQSSKDMLFQMCMQNNQLLQQLEELKKQHAQKVDELNKQFNQKSQELKDAENKRSEIMAKQAEEALLLKNVMENQPKNRFKVERNSPHYQEVNILINYSNLN